MKKRNIISILIGAVIVVIVVMLLFAFQVRYAEVAVVTTFGKPVRNISEPGLYFKWPWPIQRVFKFDGRIQNFEDKFSETITRDNNALILTVYTGWKISDASELYIKFGGSVPNAQNALEGMLRNAKNAVVSSNSLSAFVNADPKQLRFDQMEEQIEDGVQAQLNTNNYGIQLAFLGFKKIELPQSVTQSVFDRMKGERQVIINSEKYEGEKEATIIKSTADRIATETVANAKATATQIMGEGQAEAAKVMPIFEKNPALANYLLRLDALQQALNQKSTLIFDERTPPFDLFTTIPMNGPSPAPEAPANNFTTTEGTNGPSAAPRQ
ncbi:MAG TPA: protease modulator HflC [Verrucomicrobiae bacterium]|jgi:membrane protease subunit HflC|nr:protease modulator HflC [Verrucomicrobiae bacterium]